MATDVVVEIVFEDLGMGMDEARGVLGLAQARKRRPAWEDDVDQHQHLLDGSIDEDISC